MTLTEDRTLALPYMVHYHLKYWIAGNLHDRDLLERILTAHKGTLEHSLDFGRDTGPSPSFLAVAGEHLSDVRGNASARQLYKALAEL